MELKPLEPGDSVRVKYTTTIFYEPVDIYIDGTLVKLDNDDENHPRWLVEYQLEPVMGASKYQNWWYEDDITGKHHLSLTDDDYFDRAEKITIDDYDGVLFYDDHYFESLDELLEWIDDSEAEAALKYVWACDTNPVKLQLDLGSYVSQQLEEDGYEGLSERSQFQHLYDKLKLVQDNFVAMAAKEMVSYPNYKRAVIL